MNTYILITGASSGIGYEMAVQLAAQQNNLILVARNETKLRELQVSLVATYHVDVKIFSKDLSKVQAAIDLHQEIAASGLQVSALVNNAGFGNYGAFVETSLEKELRMIELNISSLVALTKLYAKDMLANGSGKIMNVASLLSFLPFPYYTVYSATKTFVLAFSETLAAELEGTGVVVTALCPGPTDTGFNTDKMKTTNVLHANKPVSAKAVAKDGVELLLNGKGKKVVGFMNWFLSNVPRFVPDKMMMRIKKKLASQKK